ncbi:hypothetical protein WKV44_07610 [Spirochaetia bacterium 38H-sp]|uniref:DUF3108 domain-containing protein n=1 Tax=Rarispira pelagica TaxID=3141764 RepID=A0ABU9UCL5_9SPIR
MKIRIITALFLFCFLINNAFSNDITSKTYVYKVENKKDNSIERTVYKVRNKNGHLIIELESKDNTWTAIQDGMFTIAWDFNSDKAKIHLEADRKKKTLSSITTDKGKNKTKEKNIDIKENIPFMNCFEFGFIPFIKNQKLDKMEFYVFRADTGELIKMVATKKDVEKINIMGKDILAIRVEITLAGWMGAFWNSTYWYDKDTGILVQFKGTLGPPGSPELFSVLEKIE